MKSVKALKRILCRYPKTHLYSVRTQEKTEHLLSERDSQNKNVDFVTADCGGMKTNKLLTSY